MFHGEQVHVLRKTISSLYLVFDRFESERRVTEWYGDFCCTRRSTSIGGMTLVVHALMPKPTRVSIHVPRAANSAIRVFRDDEPLALLCLENTIKIAPNDLRGFHLVLCLLEAKYKTVILPAGVPVFRVDGYDQSLGDLPHQFR